MKKNNIRKTGLCLLALMVMTSCGQKQTSPQTEEETVSVQMQTQEEKICDTDGQTLIEIFWQTPDFSQVLSGEGLANVEQYYENLRQQREADWYGMLKEQAQDQKNQQGSNFLFYKIENQYGVMGETDDYISLQGTITEYTGGSQEGYTLYGDTFLKENGAYLLFEDLFVQDVDYFEILSEKIVEQMNQRRQTAYYETAAQQAEILLQEGPAYYLTEEELILIYQAGELAPYAEGPQSFSIAFSEIQNILSEEYFTS